MAQGFDFSGVNFAKLDFEGFTGSTENARPFAAFERIGDVEGLAKARRLSAIELREGVREQLAVVIEQLEQTRDGLARVFEARGTRIDEDIDAITTRLNQANTIPVIDRQPNRLQIVGKLRDTTSGMGLAGLTAEAFFVNGGQETVLGRVPTDSGGNFSFSFEQDEAHAQREIRVRFFDSRGELVEGAESSAGHTCPIIDIDARDTLAAEIDQAETLSANRRTRVADLRAKKIELLAGGDVEIKKIDEQIAHAQRLLYLLGAETKTSESEPEQRGS